MTRAALSLGFVLLALGSSAAALRMPVTARRANSAKILGRRATVSTVYGSSALNNTGNLNYYTDVVLNGTTFQVIIDTGSSDLWVAGTVPDAHDTGITSGVTYAVGQVEGPVLQANLEFAGHTVANQAFLQVTPSDENPAATGLIGLGPNYGSNIFNATGGVYGGVAVVDRIFAENTSTPNFITTLLSRASDPAETFTGEVTISEVVPGYEAITSTPKLPVTNVSTSSSTRNQHWQALLDADGITVGGKAITLPASSVVGSSQLTAVFDTGFSIPQVPKAIADAMYSNVKSAQFLNITGLGPTWAMPCDSEINVSFKFGGVEFPIHPLDAVLDVNGTLADGTKFCIGGFQPITTSNGGNFDLILGMAFIRNAYLLVDYGDFQVDSAETTDPYIQLLPLTNDSAQAHSDFQTVRGGSSSGSSSGTGTRTSSSPSSTGSSSGALTGVQASGLLGALMAALAVVQAVL